MFGQGAGSANDPYWSSVVLLLGNDGAANGATTFLDQSAAAHSVTRNAATCAYTTTSPPSGLSSSINIPGNDFLKTATSADFAFGTGDFTIEVFVATTSANQADFVGQNTSNTIGAWGLLGLHNAGIGIAAQSPQFSGNVINTNLAGLNNGNWHHIAWTRAGSTNTVWGDGVSKGTASSSIDYNDTTHELRVGEGNGNYLGKLAALRITKGVARYTSGFSIPSLPFPTA